jgi:ATP-dependent protease ClpP protease subunit
MFKRKDKILKKKYFGKLLNDSDNSDEEVDNEFDSKIKKLGNKIYFYSDITGESILYLKQLLHELHIELIENSIKYQFEPIIELRIQSNGGDLFAGLDSYNFIKNFPIDIYTYIDGFIASSATFLYLGGKKRYISENSYVLIHQLTTGTWGPYSILQDEMQNNTKLMKKIIDTYKEHINMPKKTLNKILKNEMYLDYEECINYNFSTNIS